MIQDRANAWEKTLCFGLAEDPQHTDGPQPQLEGDLVDAPFLHENGPCLYLDGQGQRGGGGGIESGGATNEVGNDGSLLLAQPARKGETLKARRLADEPAEIGSDFGRDDDFAEEGDQQFVLPDAAEVQQHRSVCDNNHGAKMRRRANYFNISFTFVPSCVGGWQAVPVQR